MLLDASKHIALRWSANTKGTRSYKHGAPPQHLQPKEFSKRTFRAKLV